MRGLGLVILSVALLPLLTANPIADEPNPVFSLLRVRRQNPTTCTADADCLADQSISPAASLVQCENGACVCQSCFMLDSNGTCSDSCPRFRYNSGSGVCGQDNRPTQLTAFLLTLFVSSTGAANFYIGQGGLGGGQIALLASIIVMSFLMCYLPCCLACCVDDVKGSCVFILFMLVATVIIVCASLAMSAWYIADVIIFATNGRLSGDGCILTPWQ